MQLQKYIFNMLHLTRCSIAAAPGVKFLALILFMNLLYKLYKQTLLQAILKTLPSFSQFFPSKLKETSITLLLLLPPYEHCVFVEHKKRSQKTGHREWQLHMQTLNQAEVKQI